MKRLYIAVVVLMSFILAGSGYSQSNQYKIDPVHSNIGFEVTHMVISTVDGKFNDYAVDFSYNPDNLAESSVMAVIQTNSITTGNERRDADLRGPGFFEVEKYPTITFTSTAFEKTDKGFNVRGNLDMHGVTKEVVLPVELKGPVTDPWGNSRIGIKSNLTINRRDYNITWDKRLDNGGLVVSNDVDIRIEAELVQSKKGA